jgi:hypothetical protein
VTITVATIGVRESGETERAASGGGLSLRSRKLEGLVRYAA